MDQFLKIFFSKLEEGLEAVRTIAAAASSIADDLEEVVKKADELTSAVEGAGQAITRELSDASEALSDISDLNHRKDIRGIG